MHEATKYGGDVAGTQHVMKTTRTRVSCFCLRKDSSRSAMVRLRLSTNATHTYISVPPHRPHTPKAVVTRQAPHTPRFICTVHHNAQHTTMRELGTHAVHIDTPRTRLRLASTRTPFPEPQLPRHTASSASAAWKKNYPPRPWRCDSAVPAVPPPVSTPQSCPG